MQPMSTHSTQPTVPVMGFPTEPWRRLHVDYAGPFLGKMLLIVVDAHSKWIDVEIVNSATAPVTVEKVRKIFATHGLLTTVVSDNGAVFTSEVFETSLSEMVSITFESLHTTQHQMDRQSGQYRLLKRVLSEEVEGRWRQD